MSCDPQFEKHYPRNSSDGQWETENGKKEKGAGRERGRSEERESWWTRGKWICAKEIEENKWFIDLYILNVYDSL